MIGRAARLAGLGLAGVLVAIALSMSAAGPGRSMEIRGAARGLPSGVPATAIASRGDCLDPQRNARVLATAPVDRQGGFHLVVDRAPAGVGAVCVVAGDQGGIARLPVSAGAEGRLAVVVDVGPMIAPAPRDSRR